MDCRAQSPHVLLRQQRGAKPPRAVPVADHRRDFTAGGRATDRRHPLHGVVRAGRFPRHLRRAMALLRSGANGAVCVHRHDLSRLSRHCATNGHPLCSPATRMRRWHADEPSTRHANGSHARDGPVSTRRLHMGPNPVQGLVISVARLQSGAVRQPNAAPLASSSYEERSTLLVATKHVGSGYRLRCSHDFRSTFEQPVAESCGDRCMRCGGDLFPRVGIGSYRRRGERNMSRIRRARGCRHDGHAAPHPENS